MIAAIRVLLFVSLVIAKVKADCQLTADDIAKTNRIFAFRSGSQYYPLRLDVVRSDQTLDMICDAADVVQITCQQSGEFSPSLPLSDCSASIKPKVEQVEDDSCPYTMYRVGYKLNEQQFLELYRSCYDTQKKTAHFVIHLAYPHSLTGNRPEQSFTTDGVLSGVDAATFQGKSIYNRFEELLGSDQPYIKSARDLVFDRGHLAPSADFGFEAYMRSTFKYINVVAMFGSVNRGNWKNIETWVRKQLTSEEFPALQICTGGLEVLQLPNTNGELTSIYLHGVDSNPIPKWIYKIVSDDAGAHYAFLTYNNIHDNQKPTPNCQEVSCPSSLYLNSAKESGFSFCCDATDFIEKNAPYLKNVC